MKGTAKRTEKPIIVDTPGPVDMSVPIISMTMTRDIGIEMSQNNLHSLMALFFSITFRSILIFFHHLQWIVGRIPAIFSFPAHTVESPRQIERTLRLSGYDGGI